MDPAEAVRRTVRMQGDDLVLADTLIDLTKVERIYGVAAGKAARPMATALEAVLGDRLTAGVGVAVPESAGATQRFTLHSGGHPLPNPGSLAAARHIAKVLEGTSERDLVIVLLSGGASALMEMPVPRVMLVDLQVATSALLASGATIHEMNTVRKHLSRIKGGWLAAMAAPAACVTLVVSDVVGSDLDVIGSGPTVPDSTTFADAAEVVARYDLWRQFPSAVGNALRDGAAGRLTETPKAGDPVFARATTHVIAQNADAARSAADAAEALGRNAVVLTTWLEGEAREAGRVLAAIGKEVASSGAPAAVPACLIAGGETTVTLRRLGGHGGRNQEFALSAAIALDGWEGITVAALATDGVDGATRAAGAVIDGATVGRAHTLGVSARESLAGHDSGSFFVSLGDALITGPTGTNVNDLVVMLVGDVG